MKVRFRSAKVKTGIFASKEVLVLQVLRKYKDGPDDHNGLPTYLAGEAWEDVQVEDLIELNIKVSSTADCRPQSSLQGEVK